MISIIGLKKSKVIAALYNASIPVGRGFIEAKPIPLTGEKVLFLNSDIFSERMAKLRMKYGTGEQCSF